MAKAVLLCSPVRIGCSSFGSHEEIRAVTACSRGRERGGPLTRFRVAGFLQLRCQLQQPGQAVGPLEASASGVVEILHFLCDVGGRETLRQGAASLGRERRLRKHADQPDQQPVRVNARVPVIAPVKRRRQFAGRLHIGVGVQRMRDLVGVFLVDAVERELCETRCLDLVEFGIGHQTSAKNGAEHEQPDHGLILSSASLRAKSTSRFTSASTSPSFSYSMATSPP